jgi:hypothetical protein
MLALHGFGGTFGCAEGVDALVAIESGLAAWGVRLSVSAPRAPHSVGDGRVAWLAGDQAPLGRYVGFANNDSRIERDGPDVVQQPLSAADLPDAAGVTWHGVCGVAASIEVLERAWEAAGGYDVLLGFSQGAMTAAMLCERLKRSGTPPQCVVLVSGFAMPLPSATVSGWWPPPAGLCVPSLHVIGLADTVVANCRSEELAALFDRPRVWRHSLIGHPRGYGGHVVPWSDSFLEELAAFVQEHCVRGHMFRE